METLDGPVRFISVQIGPSFSRTYDRMMMGLPPFPDYKIVAPRNWRWRRLRVQRQLDAAARPLLKVTHGRIMGDPSLDEYVYFPKPANLLAWLLKRELHLLAHVLALLMRAHPDYTGWRVLSFPWGLLDWCWNRIHDSAFLVVAEKGLPRAWFEEVPLVDHEFPGVPIDFEKCTVALD